jgi:uncharacterized SAM-binding protein YcdF (DUF218 family)
MRRKSISKLLLIAFLLTVTVVLLSATFIVIDGLTDNIQPADVAIIPGNTIEMNGEPSARLQSRLDKAIDLYEKRIVPFMIVSGGIGTEGFDEGSVMKEYLVKHGVPAETIFVDNSGATTWLTARYASGLMKQNGWKSALVVTQYFHVPRTTLAMRRFGVSPVFSAHAQFFELRDIYSTAREVVGYYSYLLKSHN